MASPREVSGGDVEAAGDLAATATYPPEPEAVATARHFVGHILGSWQRAGRARGLDGLVDDAVLLTSELVTNAVLHAGTPLQLTCRLCGGMVEIAVTDYSPGRRVDDRQAGTIPAEGTSGRGLGLPAKLASSWGVSYTATSKTVWFRIGDATASWAAGAPLAEGLARQ
jgi:anti-sigma regulatory factor (Ser/Thr protein kinase)